MANTKIINLKRYSKKRVPKKVLKGGGPLRPAARAPRSPARGQRGQAARVVSRSPTRGQRGRSQTQLAWPSDGDDDGSQSDSGSSNGSRPGSAPLTPRKKKIKYLREKIKEENIDFLRLNAAWSSKPSFSSQDDFILHTWGDLFDNDGQPIKEFDEEFKAIAKVEVPRRPPSSARSRSTTPEPRHVRGDSPTRGHPLVREEAEARRFLSSSQTRRTQQKTTDRLSKPRPPSPPPSPQQALSGRLDRQARGPRAVDAARLRREAAEAEREARERAEKAEHKARARAEKAKRDAQLKPNNRQAARATHRIGMTRREKVYLEPDVQRRKAKRKADANEKKLQFLKKMLDKLEIHLEKHDEGAYKKYKAGINEAKKRDDYILDIWGLSYIFDHDGNIRHNRYKGDDAILEELAADVRRFGTAGEAARRRDDERLKLGIMAIGINYDAEITHRTKFNNALKKSYEAIKNKRNTTKENTIINNLAEQNRDKIRKFLYLRGAFREKTTSQRSKNL